MILNEEQRQEIIQLLRDNLEQQVTIVYFTQEQPSMELPVHVQVSPCEYCTETEQLLRELSELSDKLNLEIYDLVKDRERAEQLGITEVPALALIGDKDYGIRYYGIPSGYEFSTLLDAIINISKRRTKLADSTKEILASIEEPVQIKVFVTPT